MTNADDRPPITINTTTMDKNNADKITTNLKNRFANNNNNKNVNSPAGYLVVVNNNRNSQKSRSKRSAKEYTTLEPIDEKSLNALRKTYKHSLKEITLNPNETPDEALMRYKAESIREALEKANQKPLELTAEGEHEHYIKDDRDSSEVEAQEKDYDRRMPTPYASNDNNGPQTHMVSDAYTDVPAPVALPQTQPLAIPYNQQPEVLYETPRDGHYNNYVIKYNTPAVYDNNPKILPQNTYVSMYNPLDAVPYVDEYSVDNEGYQIASPINMNDNSFGYPQLKTYAVESPNVISKDIKNYYSPTGPIVDYSESKGSEFTNYPVGFGAKKNPYQFTNAISKHQSRNTYNQQRPSSEANYDKRFDTARNEEKLSFENLISVIKERLTQCCKECKNKILKSLDESLNAYLPPSPENHHAFTYRNPRDEQEENFEYEKWLVDMAEKGYDNNYLNRQHQEDYLKDGKLNLHIKAEEGYGREEENVFFKNNQSHKRETTESAMEKEAKTEIVIASIRTDNTLETSSIEAKEDEKDQKEKQMLAKVEQEPNEKEKEEKIKANSLKGGENANKIGNTNMKIIENKTTNRKSTENLQTTPLGNREPPTRSSYALRGKYRPRKQRPVPFSIVQAKHFDNYKSIDKIGKTNAVIKNDNQEDNKKKGNELEEIVILLSKENKKQNTTESSNVISKAEINDINIGNKIKK